MQETFQKRLAIYCFYDPDGIVDRYVAYYLSELSKVAERIVVVVNGNLSLSGRERLAQCSEQIIVRENQGFDLAAYQAGLQQIGWEKLCEYDEVILNNNSVMGPVYPFGEMFGQMALRVDLDFWGITKHLRLEQDPYHNAYGYIPEHIQSYFLVLRKKFMQSKELQRFWDELPRFDRYEDAVGQCETLFTQRFSEKGFQWDTYVNNSADEDFSEYLLLTAPQKALSEYQCPVFKKKTFYQNHDYNLSSTMGAAASKLIRFLEEKTNYDTGMIYENIIRTCNMQDLMYNLGLFYVLPEHRLTGSPISAEREKQCALILYLDRLELTEQAARYASFMPEDSDIYIAAPFREQTEKLYSVFSQVHKHIFVKPVERRGKDASALLVGCADVLHKYQYICFWHDDMRKSVRPRSVECSRNDQLSASVLASKAYVSNVIDLLQTSPRLGLLSPLPPNYGMYFNASHGGWMGNTALIEKTKQLAEQCHFRAPIDGQKPPVSPVGMVFWCRSDALKPLTQYPWKDTDFQENVGEDDTLYAAIGCACGYAAQSAGYLCAYLTTDRLASLELAASMKYWRGYQEIGRAANVWGSEAEVRNAAKFRLQYVDSLERQVRALESEVKRLTPLTSLKTQLRLHVKRWLTKAPLFRNLL